MTVGKIDMSDIIWNDDQAAAITKFRKWWLTPQEKRSEFFYLAGVAGTGKSLLANHLAEIVKGDDESAIVLFGAFTGKAAGVLRGKGCVGACTIHSMIYIPIDEVISDLDAVPNELGFCLRNELKIPDEFMEDEDECKKVVLIIIDESSMVCERLGIDLLSFNIPILVLGDKAQLPPVKDGGFFERMQPDYELTTIVRQAQDNPIIRLSMDIRGARMPAIGNYESNHGVTRVIEAKDTKPNNEMANADIVLVGTNRRRCYANWISRRLRGYKRDDWPQAGERIICLKNNKFYKVLNGTLFTLMYSVSITEAMKPDGSGVEPIIHMTLSEDDTGRIVNVCFPYAKFERAVSPEENIIEQFIGESKRTFEWGFGYVITVHKFQGSQTDHVLLIDESERFCQDRWRWLYTGITRAVKTVTLITNPNPVPNDPRFWGAEKFVIPVLKKEGIE